jgi:competence ComEA-like helix-hairpin-helix protein
MKFLKEITGLTAKEISLIIFFIITVLIGLILKYSGWKNPEKFDYSESDYNFENRLKNSFNVLQELQADSNAKLRIKEIEALRDSLELKDEDNKSNSVSKNSTKILEQGKLVNINTALADEIALLPGIGEITAEKIIEYRIKSGGFRKIEDIKKVKGISEKKFEQIKNFISVK